MSRALDVKTKIIDSTTFSLLFRNKSVKIDFLIEDRVDLRQIYNNVVIVNEFINARNNYDDEGFKQIDEGVTLTKGGISTHLIIYKL